MGMEKDLLWKMKLDDSKWEVDAEAMMFSILPMDLK
jgi:hypothetical protein